MSKVHGTVENIEQFEDHKEIITCYSLIDITTTGVVGNFNESAPKFFDDAKQLINSIQTWTRSRNQQRNFETIIQTASLRAQPIYLETPKSVNGKMLEFKFGSDYQGTNRVWSFRFSVEHTDVFSKDGNRLAILMQDLNLVPCILKLTETIKLTDSVFITEDEKKRNIYFDILH